MRHDGSEIRHRGEDREDTNKRIEGSLTANKNASENRRAAPTDKGRIERIPEPLVNLP